MIETLPSYIPIVFALITVATLMLFYWAIRNATDIAVRKNSVKILLFLLLWLGLQAVLSLKGVYSQNTDAIPPKIFLMGVLPPIITMIFLFFSKAGRQFIDSLSLEKLTYISIVRIPVEICLLWLFLNKVIPQIMTFEGWNFDILAGLTAPLIIYFGFKKGNIGKTGILAWNIIGLCLLLTIVAIAFLSAPFPLQQLAFDMPNIGVLYFPFSWLPTFVVPVVLFTHFVSIGRLLRRSN